MTRRIGEHHPHPRQSHAADGKINSSLERAMAGERRQTRASLEKHDVLVLNGTF